MRGGRGAFRGMGIKHKGVSLVKFCFLVYISLKDKSCMYTHIQKTNTTVQVFAAKLIIAQLVNKFPHFYGI
jgi:hypothetical protein